MKTTELRGLKSLRALNVFHTLMLGLKMLPMYAKETYADFLARAQEMSPPDQELLIREAILFVELEKSELEAALGFCLDPNGIPYDQTNLKNLKPEEILEGLVAVCMQVARIRVDLVSDREKKKSLTAPLT